MIFQISGRRLQKKTIEIKCVFEEGYNANFTKNQNKIETPSLQMKRMATQNRNPRTF